jgi:hypothetical protein
MIKHKTLTCPNCGNTQVNEFELHIKHPCHSIHSLVVEPDGTMYAKKKQEGLIHQSRNLGQSIFCIQCHTPFPSPGIPLK